MEGDEGERRFAADRMFGRACLSREEMKTATLLANVLFTNGGAISC